MCKLCNYSGVPMGFFCHAQMNCSKQYFIDAFLGGGGYKTTLPFHNYFIKSNNFSNRQYSSLELIVHSGNAVCATL